MQWKVLGHILNNWAQNVKLMTDDQQSDISVLASLVTHALNMTRWGPGCVMNFGLKSAFNSVSLFINSIPDDILILGGGKLLKATATPCRTVH